MSSSGSNDEARPTLTGIARGLNNLPSEKKRAALEVSAALAAVSLKVSREFVEAVPAAAELLSAEDIRQWGELGRRMAMGSADIGVKFFAAGVQPLSKLPAGARRDFFEVCKRQLVLSSSIALETFQALPKIAARVKDPQIMAEALRLSVEIAQRSAKHSSEFLAKTPGVAASLERFGEDKPAVAEALVELAQQFAGRTGGMTADLWASVPTSLEKLTAAQAIQLFSRATAFLDHGGSVTLHFISSGSDALQFDAVVFDEWSELGKVIAASGNAVLISFLRSSPTFFDRAARRREQTSTDLSRILRLIGKIAESDAESALAAFRSSAFSLDKVSADQFGSWIDAGLEEFLDGSSRSRRSYFALETRVSNERLQETKAGLMLDAVRPVLRMYVEALTGREIEIASLTDIPQESRIGDGKTVHLPSAVAEFEVEAMNFRLYKVLAAHGAGQIEFGTFETDTPELRSAYAELKTLYDSTADERDAFSLSGYLEDVQKAERWDGTESRGELRMPENSDYRSVIKVFPEPGLARKIFGTMENARIDARLRQTYRGLVRDLDLMQAYLKQHRPYIFDLPMYQVPFELLFQITMCGGATEDARRFYGQVVSEIETIVERFLQGRTSSVADSLIAASRVYTLFHNLAPEQTSETQQDEQSADSEFAYEDKDAAEGVTENRIEREKRPEFDVRDLFNAWNSLDEEGEPDNLQGAEAWSHHDMPEQALEADDVAFAYDEWDRELSDYRVGWSRVIEKRVKQGDRTFVELTRSRYRGVISSIRHQFQLMKPENLTRINRELDGEDYDLNALVDFVIDRRADGKQTENIYTKRLRKQRDVAVSLLLDQSSSTARTITRNPLQPYTHPGRRIIEIEKEGLVLMSEALEAVGDAYSIYGFTSEGRRNVKFYVVKDFGEKYSDEIERRIGGITFQNNTRLGAAIRHAAHKLLRQESRTKLLIILTDGRPYDHDYGDARYARDDVREALTEAKSLGIIPFCITIDRESEAELKELYGNVGYTIIDDVLSLPERIPNIYRRLTS